MRCQWLQFIEIGTKSHHGQAIVSKGAAAAAGDAGQKQQQQAAAAAAAVETKAAEGAPWPTKGDTVHIAYTSNGSPYTNYQVWQLGCPTGCCGK